MTNPFSDLGKEIASRKRKPGSLKLVPKTQQDKKQAAQDKQFELWMIDQAKRKQALMKGPYAGTALALCGLLEVLGFDDGEKLIEVAQAWQGAPRSTRFLVLQLIDEAMINLRERHGLAPFDDPIFDDEENCFIRIRRLLE